MWKNANVKKCSNQKESFNCFFLLLFLTEFSKHSRAEWNPAGVLWYSDAKIWPKFGQNKLISYNAHFLPISIIFFSYCSIRQIKFFKWKITNFFFPENEGKTRFMLWISLIGEETSVTFKLQVLNFIPFIIWNQFHSFVKFENKQKLKFIFFANVSC